MENASKALLIAGGVLIALIIITMFIMMYNGIASMQAEQEEQTLIEQLAAFNAEYEAYDKDIMYGADVITLINKVAENNKKYKDNNDYKITLIVDGTETYDSTGLIDTDFKTTIYTCTSIEYNTLGRVSKIVIAKKY